MILMSIILLLTASGAWAAQKVTIDGSGTGRIFDGIGLVNSSGTSKLLQDYPPEQQSDILDFLFTPNFGAGLTIMRNEIGGDINSSTGTEPSHQRLAADAPVARGVNFWIAREAKNRNPEMQFVGSRWGIPAWADSSNTNKLNYYLSYLDLMTANGTPLDYLSPEENEGSFDRDYVVNTLKPALDANGYGSLKLVAREAYQSWAIADTIQTDTALKHILSAINNHYVTTSTSNALNCGLPLFNDEADTPMLDWWERMMFVAINNAKQYVDGKMVRVLYQPALDSVYNTLKYNHKGILTASTPWSGHYTVHPALWMTAHYTQFAKPGWQFIDNASGSIDSDNYYVTLRDLSTTDYSIVLINAGSTDTEYTFTLTGGLSTGVVHVWRTNRTEQFVQQADITTTGGVFSITIPAQSVYSLTTTTGQQKGIPTCGIPADTAFSLPYTDDFSTYSVGQQPKYFYDQAGAFEVVDLSGNQCIQQVVTVPPIEWGVGGSSSRAPYTVFGDPRLVNYQLSVDVNLNSTGTALFSVRGTLHNRDGNYPPSGYQIQLWPSGNWYFRKVTFGNSVDNANGNVVGFDPAAWHTVKLVANGATITAYIDGNMVTTCIDSEFSSGQAALGTNYHTVAFDNLRIAPIDATTPASALKVNDKDAVITYNGGWYDQNGSWQDYARSSKNSNSAGASLEYTFTGSEIFILGRKGSNSGKADVYIDNVKHTNIDAYNSSTLYRTPIYQHTGLISGMHTVRLVVSGTHNALSTDSYIWIDSIETLDGTPPNLALNKPAYADSEDAAYLAGDGNDGDIATHWSAADENTGHWWMVDLGDRYELTGSEVLWEFDDRQYQYIVEVSKNGTDWTVVVDKSGNTETSQIQRDNFNAAGRYVRITVTGLPTTPVTRASFYEFQVFGTHAPEILLPDLVINDNTTGTDLHQFEYVGSWSYGSQSGAYMNDNHWEGDTDGYYQVRFTGEQIMIYAAKAPNHGIAAVSIDGGAETMVDFYSASRQEQALVYTSPMLSADQHILKVRVTGTKNANSSGVPIPADRVDVYTLAAPKIAITQNTVNVPNGETFPFGEQNTDSQTDITFAIENQGTMPLTLTGDPVIKLSGTDMDQFSVEQEPAVTIGAGEQSTYVIRFAPTSEGEKTAMISIENSDSTADPYEITLTGTGVEEIEPTYILWTR